MLFFIGFGIEITRHGKEKKPGKHNAFATIIPSLIVLLILYWGGFFDKILN